MMSTDKKEGMTKSQAIKAMRDGKKVTHRFFDRYEWVTMKGDKVFTEEGYSCGEGIFWHDRRGKEWLTDWKIFEDNQTK